MVSEHGTIRARRTGIVDLRSANLAQWLRFSQNRSGTVGSASGISHATRRQCLRRSLSCSLALWIRDSDAQPSTVRPTRSREPGSCAQFRHRSSAASCSRGEGVRLRLPVQPDNSDAQQPPSGVGRAASRGVGAMIGRPEALLERPCAGAGVRRCHAPAPGAFGAGLGAGIRFCENRSH